MDAHGRRGHWPAHDLQSSQCKRYCVPFQSKDNILRVIVIETNFFNELTEIIAMEMLMNSIDPTKDVSTMRCGGGEMSGKHGPKH